MYELPSPPSDSRQLDKQLRLLAHGHRAFAVLNTLLTVAFLPIAVQIARVKWDEQIAQMEAAGFTDVPDFGGFRLIIVITFVLLAAIAATVFWSMAGWVERRVRWRALIGISVLNLIAFPIGTVLSVFTLVTLLDPRTKASFRQ